MEPDQQFIQEPLQTQVRLTCNAIRNDTIAIEWQVQIRGFPTFTASRIVLGLNDIILSEKSAISRSIEITLTRRNSGSVCRCVVAAPGRTGGADICGSEPITVVFYGTCVSHTSYNIINRH